MATHSFISPSFAKELNVDVTAVSGTVSLADAQSKVKRLGRTPPLYIKHNKISIKHSFEVFNIGKDNDKDINLVFGLDILPKLNISLEGLCTIFDLEEITESNDEKSVTTKPRPNQALVDALVAKHDVRSAAKALDKLEFNKEADSSYTDLLHAYQHLCLTNLSDLLDVNKSISGFCNLRDSIITLDTGAHPPIHRPQYRIPYSLTPTVDKQIQDWLDEGIIATST
ncbi:hypothetical protein ROZALSC1DRAFT_31761, partial [Rozella allomycis CSF55]